MIYIKGELLEVATIQKADSSGYAILTIKVSDFYRTKDGVTVPTQYVTRVFADLGLIQSFAPNTGRLEFFAIRTSKSGNRKFKWLAAA